MSRRSFQLGLILLATLGLMSCSDGSSAVQFDLGGNLPPTATVVSPNGSEALTGVVTIRWTTGGRRGIVNVLLSSDSGATYDTILADKIADEGRFDWDVGAFPELETYRIRVVPSSSTSGRGTPDDSDADFAVDHTAPDTTLSEPSGSEDWTGTRTVRWITTDRHPGTVNLRLSSDSGATFPTIIATGVPDTGEYDWHTNDFGQGTTYRLRVVPTDAAGNVGAPVDSAADFTLNHRPRVEGFARYEDLDLDGPDAGDSLIVPFRTDVVVNGAADSDFNLPVPGDLFGDGASVVGPAADPALAPNEIRVLLGTSPSLKTRQRFPENKGVLEPNDPSGIDVSAMIAAGIIQNPDGNFDAEATTPVDVVPGFVDSGQRMRQDLTRDVALGDLDGDGDLDLVDGNFGTPNRVWMNTGGVFSDSRQTLGSGATTSLLLADFDHDRDLDLIAGNANSEGDTFWLNDGSGNFAIRQVFGATDTRGVAAVDLDGDGDLDLVLANGSGPNPVFENRAGVFIEGAQIGMGPTLAVALADVNRDGFLDLIEGNEAAPDRVLLADDKGEFQEPGQSLGGNATTTSLALGDVDRDGDLDFLTGDASGPDRLWINGNGSFGDSGLRLGNEPTSDLALVDADQDGALDLLQTTPGGTSHFWVGDGLGGFLDSGQSLGPNVSRAVAVGDVDGDSDVDLAIGNDDEANRVYLQSLSGSAGRTWGSTSLVLSPQPFLPTESFDSELADLDRDGDLDLIIGDLNLATTVWFNDGAGNYTLAQQLPINGPTRVVSVGDVNGDGFLDLVETYDTLGVDGVWLNDGTGLFELGTAITANANSFAADLADFDGDGDQDYLLTDFDAANSLYLNDGEGDFGTPVQFFGFPDTFSVAVADVDMDGDLDAVTVDNTTAFHAHVWINSGGRFGLGQAIILDGNAEIVLGDLVGNSAPDFVVSSINFDMLVYRNNGDGTFVFHAGGVALGGTIGWGVQVADLDGDGDLDIPVTTSNTEQTLVYWNDAGSFARMTPYSTPNIFLPYDMEAGDVDRDGDCDLIISSTAAGIPVSVWLNR